MEKIKEFFSKPLNLIIIFSIIVLSLGVGIGYLLFKNNNLKEVEKGLIEDIKNKEEIIKNSSKNAEILIDSANIYKIYVEREKSISVKLNKDINKTKKDAKNKIFAVDTFSNSQLIREFARQSEAYKH